MLIAYEKNYSHYYRICLKVYSESFIATSYTRPNTQQSQSAALSHTRLNPNPNLNPCPKELSIEWKKVQHVSACTFLKLLLQYHTNMVLTTQDQAENAFHKISEEILSRNPEKGYRPDWMLLRTRLVMFLPNTSSKMKPNLRGNFSRFGRGRPLLRS